MLVVYVNIIAELKRVRTIKKAFKAKYVAILLIGKKFKLNK
jgi:hypothetical protein